MMKVSPVDDHVIMDDYFQLSSRDPRTLNPEETIFVGKMRDYLSRHEYSPIQEILALQSDAAVYAGDFDEEIRDLHDRAMASRMWG